MEMQSDLEMLRQISRDAGLPRADFDLLKHDPRMLKSISELSVIRNSELTLSKSGYPELSSIQGSSGIHPQILGHSVESQNDLFVKHGPLLAKALEKDL